jgi:L-erythrulose 1-phosphate isomerase
VGDGAGSLMRSDVLVAVSLKAYFGVAQTRGWLRELAVMLAHDGLPDGVQTVVFPSFPLLERAHIELDRYGIRVGAQDVSWAECGPMTGEVPASMLAEMGCRYAEVGHAERRRYFGEDDEVVAAKAEAAARHGLIPLICVGEQSQGSEHAAAEVVRQARLVVDRIAGRPFVIAYEPVWAIGADEPADAKEVLHVGAALRASLPELGISGRLIYGGTAGAGTLTQLAEGFDGIFLGRRAHRIDGLRAVLDEAAALLSATAAPMSGDRS